VVDELVPFIDEKYPTIADADNRGYIGVDEGGYAAFYATFKYPDVFSRIAGQSTHFYPTEAGALRELIETSDKLSLTIYMDWGKYDSRNAQQGYSWRDLNEEFATFLKSKGYTIEGGEVNEGFEWANWRNRTDKILQTLFPLN
jgi:enterochelin esterase-like enzyme